MIDSDLTFGAWLRRRRRGLDLTREELAARAGCSVSALRKFEADTLRPSKALAELLADALGIAPEHRAAFVRFARDAPTGQEVALPVPAISASSPPVPPSGHPQLPTPATPLIGRETECAEVRALLQHPETRLVTLTGPGGIGKTRLALQVGTELIEQFPDGIWFVDLAPISDPDLAIPAIMQSLGVKEQGQQPAAQQLQAHLRDKQLLLVLDNFEQVVDAAPRIAELLAAAPQLKLLVTSRVVLHIRGEQEAPVPPLALPDPHQRPPLEAVSQYAAVALFIARAQAVKPDFAITNQTAPAVAEICVRLDGLPLAIELAAARIKLFSPQMLPKRLERSLGVLIGGPRDAPARQQTIRNTIDWSYQLLDEGQQTVFRRLGVFVGGCTLEAAEATCNADGNLPFDVVEGVAALLDKSLLRQEQGSDSDSRIVMLETIREYALERLVEFGEAAALRQAHAAHYLALAEMARSHLEGPQQEMWLTRLEADHDNLRTAIQSEVEHRNNTEVALRFGVALWYFWWKRGYLSEGLARLEELLSLAAAGPSTAAHSGLRASILLGAGRMANDRADYQGARAYLEESQTLWQELGDQRGVAQVLATLGQMANDQNDYPAARATLEQSLALFQVIGDKQGIARVLDTLAWIVRKQGDDQAARQFAEQSLLLARDLGDMQTIALALDNLGYINLHSDPAQAGQLFVQSLALFQALGAKQDISSALYGLGMTSLIMGNYDEATARFTEALELRQALGDRRGYFAVIQNLGNAALLQGDSTRGRMYYQDALMGARAIDNFEIICCGLEGFACAAALDGQAERAAHLLGAAAALRESLGMVIDPDQRLVVDRAVEYTRASLDAEAFTTLWELGRAMPLEQAIAEALEQERSEAGEVDPRARF